MVTIVKRNMTGATQVLVGTVPPASTVKTKSTVNALSDFRENFARKVNDHSFLVVSDVS